MACPPYCKSPRQFLTEYTYRDLRLIAVEMANRIDNQRFQ